MDFISELEKNGFSEEELKDINECLTNLLSTIVGEQGLDRDFGIDVNGIMDAPPEQSKNMTSLEVIEKVDKYEPRVEVDNIGFKLRDDGKMIPVIFFKKREVEDEET